ncbi:MAG: helix-hairpin-helix domain-containing protein [bacterium]|nr:MAG: helix-hairpin-helix domain-containing protein [bacterium]
MSNKLLFLLACLIYFATTVSAQEPEIEELLEQGKEYSDISELLEMLAEFEQSPIDLNQATAEQLAVLPWISNVLAVAIINYRNQLGEFNTIEQLKQIKNLNPDLIPVLRKYITVYPKKFEKDLSFTTKTRLSRKLEKSVGLKDGSYYPSPTKVYNRFIINYGNNLRCGLLLERDSGERRIDDLRLHFVSYRSTSTENKLIIGNYRLEFARGLIFGNPYGYYKGNAPLYPAKRGGRGLLEYALVDENASLYGLSGQFCFKIYQLILFFSAAKLDATINSDGTVLNFYTTGYHRTSIELEKKDRLTEQLVGSRFYIKPAPYFSLGITYYRSLFDHAAAIQEEVKHRFSFRGRVNEVIGIDYNLTLGRFNVLSELARSSHNGFGLLIGILMDAHPLELLILARNYSKNFISFHGSSFSEGSGHPQNEQGIYFGFRYKPLKNIELNLYFDQFKFPWRTYFVPMPSMGKDFLLRCEHKPIKNLLLSFQFKYAQKEEYFGTSKIIIPRNQKNLRFQLEFQPWTAIKFRHRIEKTWVSYNKYIQIQYGYPDHFEGILIYQDVILKFNKNFNMAARITLFDTDDYESRLYQFEHDVPGMLTNQMLFGMGNRWYMKIQWNVKKSIKFSIKFGSTQYHHVNSIGSNADMILANTLNSINLQLETNW